MNKILESLATEKRMMTGYLLSKYRNTELLEARQFLFKLCVLKGFSPYTISRRFGKSNATVINALKRFEQYYETDKNYRERFEKIRVKNN